MDCSLPGSSVHGIFQARVLEWVAISFFRRSSWPRDRTRVSCIVGRCFTIWAITLNTVQVPYFCLGNSTYLLQKRSTRSLGLKWIFFSWRIYLLLKVGSPTITVLSLSFFRSASIWWTYLDALSAPASGPYMYMLCIFLTNGLFHHYILTFFVFCYNFGLKSILSDISITNPALFWFPLAWISFFSFYLCTLHLHKGFAFLIHPSLLVFCLQHSINLHSE